MDEIADLRQRVSDLEAGLLDMALRHSALEWIVEQTTANWLLHQSGAFEFLEAIKHDAANPWRAAEEGAQDVRPDWASSFQAHVAHIADKIAERISQGPRA